MTQSSASSNSNNWPKDAAKIPGLPNPNDMVSRYGGWYEDDSDSDGILDVYDQDKVHDQDKVPDSLDLDADNDGILDLIELNAGTAISDKSLSEDEKEG